ncbi:MAG: hypothetical protein J6Y84_05080 [Bacteroidaceae bacterium]|nr:hypothetical protein [Bacteroidaceae bacterium]
MIYRFTFISDEVDHFLREIKINSDASFLDFHKAILESVGYPDDQMTSFFICNEDWEKETEITREDMGTSSDVDNYVMEDTALDELIEEEKQRLLYVFDPLAERVFFIELSEIIPGKSIAEPICSRKEGKAPKQTLDFDQLMSINPSSSFDIDDSFGDNENVDIDELDMEGIGFLDDISNDDII